MTASTREVIEAAVARHRQARERGDWAALASEFAENAGYFDSIHGWTRGRGQIQAFLERVMRQSGDWEFPELWRAIDGDRVVFGWAQRYAEPRPDGTPYEFRGITSLLFDGNGHWAEQMDVYDTAFASKILHEWAIARRDGLGAGGIGSAEGESQ